MLIGGIALGLVLGLFAGGDLLNLGSVRLRRLTLLILAVFVRFGTELALNEGVPLVESLRLPLLAGSFVLLLFALWPNRSYPGISLAFIGVLANALVIVVNGGYMPIWITSLEIAGLTPADVMSSLHYVLPPPLDGSHHVKLRSFRQVDDLLDDFVGGLRTDRNAALGAIRLAQAGEENAQIVVNLRHSADGRARTFAGCLLLDTDGWRKPVDVLDLWLLHLAEKLPGIRR